MISNNKAGTIVEFDKDTNEISIELYNNKYNQVLNRPSKFSVILDETDKENMDEQSDELSRTSQGSENMVRIISIVIFQFDRLILINPCILI